MSTPTERTRALVWAGGLLVQISRDRNLPLALRRQATVIARHFPTLEDVVRLSLLTETTPRRLERPLSQEIEAWCYELNHGPLIESTRLAWPD